MINLEIIGVDNLLIFSDETMTYVLLYDLNDTMADPNLNSILETPTDIFYDYLATITI